LRCGERAPAVESSFERWRQDPGKCMSRKGFDAVGYRGPKPPQKRPNGGKLPEFARRDRLFFRRVPKWNCPKSGLGAIVPRGTIPALGTFREMFHVEQSPRQLAFEFSLLAPSPPGQPRIRRSSAAARWAGLGPGNPLSINRSRDLFHRKTFTHALHHPLHCLP